MHNYKQLSVWQNAVDLAVLIYDATSSFPTEERYGLTSQLRRAAVSVSSNIAEGAGRNTNGEFIQFLGVAVGSLHELETQLVISHKLKFINEVVLQNTCLKIIEILNKIYKLQTSLRKQKPPNT